MELDRIEEILKLYFEGNTTLAEEALLLDYFNNQKVASHLLEYKPIFIGLAAAKQESSSKVFQLEEEAPVGKNHTWRYAVAVLFLVAFGIGSFFLAPSQMTEEEQEALTAFEESKKAMMFLSENLNKGVKQLSYVDQFGKATNKVWKDPVD